jgi:hypothetical protein
MMTESKTVRRSKRIATGMIEFAKQNGAMRGGRPDWYVVAEILAVLARPDLLNDYSASRSVGREKGPWPFLFVDVQEVRRQKHCSILKACEHLSAGYHPHSYSKVINGKQMTFRMASGAWKGKKPTTLRQRYLQHLREWREVYK